ncbi:MAG: HAMP domain-containing histidine kinase [Elusimicrobia bacterium]|nr:HAMP domain-containing histidine kinase [Elusimicrobiota bacterium]
MTIRTKFSLMASGLVLAVVGLAGTLQFQLQRRDLARAQRSGLGRSAGRLADAVHTAWAARDLRALDAAVETAPRPAYAVLTSGDGKVLFDSRSRGDSSLRYASDDRTQAALNALGPAEFSYREGGRELLEFAFPAGSGSGKTVLRAVYDLSAPAAGAALGASLRRQLGIAALSLVVGLLGAAWLAANFNRTLGKLSDAARHIGAGELSYQVMTQRADELGQLSADFNAMGQKLAELEAMKQRFLESVTHDLKSPLASIDGYAKVIAMGLSGPVTDLQKKQLEAMTSSSSRLARMIDDILDLSKMEAGKMEFDFAPLDVGRVAQSTRDLLSVLAEKYEVTLEARVEEGLPAVEADSDQIHRVVTNLVSNALKFTPKGGRITVHVRRGDGGGLVIGVQDTGVGIPKDKLGSMFTKFFQVQETKNEARARGTGLGLTICRRIVEAHGGEIWVESEWRKGSTFSFSLLAKPPVAAPAA